jgi:hypothetical protein
VVVSVDMCMCVCGSVMDGSKCMVYRSRSVDVYVCFVCVGCVLA